MKNIAIIPARGGSQRIPNKNIKDFFGKPIISYSINTALTSNLFDEVMVSTDSQEIAELSQKNGATVPFLRSDLNSNNYSTLTDVLIEVINKYVECGKYFDSICCILPTAVLISQDNLRKAYTEFNEKDFSSVVPIVKYAYPIQRALQVNNDFIQMREPKYNKERSQDLETFFHDSGQFYWIKTQAVLNEKSIFTDKTGYIEIDEINSQDVDTVSDWELLTLKYNFSINK